MPWGSVRGHDAQGNVLRRAMASGRFPHAFLFVGPRGVGKTAFAQTLAQALLCERNPETALEPCGECPSCRQVVEGSHPDVLRVSKPEDKQQLPIDKIRDLCLDLGLKPMSGHRRVAIVEDADDLSEEAANAFLKTLEEPPPGSVLILIGTAAESQIQTVVSRCRLLRFNPLTEDELADVLLAEGIVEDRDKAVELARRSEGSVATARGLADPEFGTIRRDMLDALAAGPRFDPLKIAARLTAYSENAGKESAAKRLRATTVLGELARFFRGVLWQTAGLEPESPDPADRRVIAALVERLEPEDVFVLADRCLEAIGQVERNAGRGLVFEALARDVARVVQVKQASP